MSDTHTHTRAHGTHKPCLIPFTVKGTEAQRIKYISQSCSAGRGPRRDSVSLNGGAEGDRLPEGGRTRDGRRVISRPVDDVATLQRKPLGRLQRMVFFQDPNEKGNNRPASVHLATYHQEGTFKEKRCHLFSKRHLDPRPGLREWGEKKKSWEAANKDPRGEGSGTSAP